MNRVDNSSFCVLPFIGCTGDLDGTIRLCCEDKDIKHDKKLGSIQKGSFDQLRNGKYISEVRKKMLQGEKISHCRVCHKQESQGVPSMRQKFYEKYKHKIPYILRNVDASSGKIDTDILYLDIRFSSLCNLSCRMCWSGSSSSRRELDDLLGKDTKEIFTGRWRGTDVFGLNGIFKNIETIYIAGGEPLMDKDCYRFLENIVAEGKASNISLKINTNLTILSERFLEIFKKFKKVEFIASCDGYGQKYEYIRIGAQWNIFIENLQRLLRFLPQLGDGSKIDVNTVVQRDNVYNISKLYILCYRLGIRNNLTFLHTPLNLAIHNIPEGEKKEIDIFYRNFIQNNISISGLQQDFENLLTVLFSDVSSIKEMDTFLKEKIIIDTYMNKI